MDLLLHDGAACLIASSEELKQRARFDLPTNETVRLGRSPRHGFAVPWDRMISSEHADLVIKDGVLKVTQLKTARNPIRMQGQIVTEFEVVSGERFVIGATEFRFANAQPGGEEHKLIDERSFNRQQLRQFSFGNANQRLEVLSELPSLLSASKAEDEAAVGLVDLLLKSIPHSVAVAVMHYDLPVDSANAQPRMMRWNCRPDQIGRFRPSRRLLFTAMNRNESLLYIWPQTAAEDSGRYTISFGLHWAFCIPFMTNPERGWCLYIAGAGNPSGGGNVSAEEVMPELRFAELLGSFFNSMHQVQRLRSTQAAMSQFFAPAVMARLVAEGADTHLEPQDGDFSILFCDVRGFSRKTELEAQNLKALLQRVSDALSVITRNIMRFEGVIADFQGDAAMAFWGWPTFLADGPIPACRAAMAMQEELKRANVDQINSLYGFEVGIGIGHGQAVAGKIGPPEQAKVGVFGPVVNLTSRLEGMTKQFRVPILIDEATAQFVHNHLPPEEARCRPLARVRPQGMQNPLLVYELLPPVTVEGAMTDAHVAEHGLAVDAFLAGRWAEALERFHKLPESDHSKDLVTRFMAQHNYAPPENWDGTIPLQQK
jgi:adenylate cyclase